MTEQPEVNTTLFVTKQLKSGIPFQYLWKMLMGELWSVFYEDLGENWLCYNDITLHIIILNS